MGKQYLIPVKDLADAHRAIGRVPDIAEKGDEIVLLMISEIPEPELIGSGPPETVLDPLKNSGGVSSAPRAADDVPEFIGREELMDSQGEELREAMNPEIARLHELGYQARVETMFSDKPGDTIRDYAGDLQVNDVYITKEFRDDLDKETQEVVKTI
jgi:hypothetical protein